MVLGVPILKHFRVDKMVMIRNSRLTACPLIKRLLLQNHWTELGDILQEAYGASPYRQQLKLSLGLKTYLKWVG